MLWVLHTFDLQQVAFYEKKVWVSFKHDAFFSDLRINVVFESFCTISYPHIRIGITHKQKSWV